MMHNVAYLTATMFGICGVWFVWDLGLKKLLLDCFRERLFELRFKLFSLGASGQLSFDDDAYRSIETLLCGLIRYAHRVTFMCYFFSAIEQDKAKTSKEYVDFHQQLRLKISRTEPAVQIELNGLLADTSRVVILYIGLSSLFFMVSLPLILLFRSFNMLRSFTRTAVVDVLESEAYRAESRQTKLEGRLPA